MSNEAWIQQSLERLETLETQKETYESSGQPVPAEMNAEISALYETLEAVASSEEGAAAPANPAAESHAALGGPPMPGPGPGWGAPAQAPMGVPHAGAPPFGAGAPAPAYGAPPAAAPMMAPDPGVDYSAMADVDVDMPKSKAPIVIGVLVALIAVGGGGFYMMQQSKAEEPAAAPVGEAKVIGASEIPEDTQEPKVAEGADVARTPLQEIPDGPSRRGTHRRSGGGKRSGGHSGGKSKKDSGHKVDIKDDSRDPLAGLK